ncbi:hypothetical protein VP01_1690g1 [Puccinia sorghi]|uniref:Uncharacterized protein n=1 Tax=Puccinia sorghi TaxID=27349 RepID=A0A0L6VHP2_9BASI|nr:hypothetical protein VP01_1690g1 [Puccinia sorghi]
MGMSWNMVVTMKGYASQPHVAYLVVGFKIKNCSMARLAVGLKKKVQFFLILFGMRASFHASHRLPRSNATRGPYVDSVVDCALQNEIMPHSSIAGHVCDVIMRMHWCSKEIIIAIHFELDLKLIRDLNISPRHPGHRVDCHGLPLYAIYNTDLLVDGTTVASLHGGPISEEVVHVRASTPCHSLAGCMESVTEKIDQGSLVTVSSSTTRPLPPPPKSHKYPSTLSDRTLTYLQKDPHGRPLPILKIHSIHPVKHITPSAEVRNISFFLRVIASPNHVTSIFPALFYFLVPVGMLCEPRIRRQEDLQCFGVRRKSSSSLFPRACAGSVIDAAPFPIASLRPLDTRRIPSYASPKVFFFVWF